MAANSLSRRGETEDGGLLAISAVETDWIDQIREMVQTDKFFQELKSKWDAGSLDPGVFQLKNGVFLL